MWCQPRSVLRTRPGRCLVLPSSTRPGSACSSPPCSGHPSPLERPSLDLGVPGPPLLLSPALPSHGSYQHLRETLSRWQERPWEGWVSKEGVPDLRGQEV